MAKLVKTTYANALFEFAVENNRLNDIVDEFGFVIDVFNKYEEFFKLYDTPKLSADKRKAIVKEIFENKISNEMLNFLFILLDKRRTGNVFEIKDEVDKLVDKNLNIERAYVKSAIVLNEKEKIMIKENLEKMVGKKIKLKAVVDEDIIGGLYIKIGDKVIDGSLKNKLDNMKEDLTKIIV